jgi:hypothetical protein
MYEQLDPLQIPFQNLTQIIPIPSGGILTTLYINAVLCFIMFLIFVLFIIHLPLFNLPEKKRTQRRIKRDFEFIQHGAITSQEPIFTNSETFLNRIKNLFMLMLNSVLAFIPFCFKENKKEFQYLVENYGKEATVYSLFLKELLWAFIICAFVGMAILFGVSSEWRQRDTRRIFHLQNNRLHGCRNSLEALLSCVFDIFLCLHFPHFYCKIFCFDFFVQDK